MKSRVSLNDPALIVIFLLIVDSLHFIFARLLLPHLPPITSALYVIGTGLVEVALFSLVRGRLNFQLFRRHAWFFISIGFLVASSTCLSYGSVAFIDPGTASLLAETSVLFGLAFGLVWLRERLAVLESTGALVAVAGVFIISFQPGDYLRLGSVMVLVSAFAYALHAALVKRYSSSMDLAEFFLFRLACTTGFLFLFAAGQGLLVWPDRVTWPLIALAGSVDVVLSRIFYYLALRRLQLSLHSLVLTLSPVVTIMWSLLLFGLWPASRELIGGLAVLTGIFIISTSRAGLLRSKRLATSTQLDKTEKSV